MTDRDKEIEALAMKLFVRLGDAEIPISSCLVNAAQAFHDLSFWRSARNQPPAPEAAEPEAAEPTPPANLKALAEKIAANLFSDMYGHRVDRLVLTYDDPKKDMGGLCFGVARDQVLEVLKAEPTPPALPTDRMGKLEMLVRLAIELGDRTPVIQGELLLNVTSLEASELTRLQALAAELTAKDGRDG